MRIFQLYILLLIGTWGSAQAVSFKDFSKTIKVSNQSKINSEGTDFAPSYWTDYIVYSTSKRKQKIFDPNTKEAFFNLYLAGINQNNELERSAQLSKVLNTQFHEATTCFSNDDKHIYFSRMNEEGLMFIFESDYSEGEWTDAEPSFLNELESQSMHPTVLKDNSIIIFSSDRPGGYGLMDLYYSKFDNGNWSEPMNLGENINTKGNDVFPFLGQDNFLFFSSDGYKKGSDLDIYKVRYSDEGFEKPIVLPLPINSKYDDLSFILDFEGKSGFFSSNRPGGKGKDDIYNFIAEESIYGYGEKSYNTINVFTKNKKTQEVLTDVILRYRHLEEGETFLFDKSLFDISKDTYDSIYVDNKGRAQIKLHNGYTLIEAESPDRVKWQVAVTNKLENKTLDIFLEDIAIEEKIVEEIPEIPKELKDTDLNIGTVVVFDNIYYAYNSHELQKGATLELDELAETMLKNPNLKIQLSSHTDSRGEDDYNLLLSEKRAITARQYLVEKGITPNRIFTIGYGEQDLRNHCKDGVFCTEDEHLYNRRTEVRILEN